MLMRDEIHAIHLGIISTLIRAILRAFMDIVKNVLDIQGRAAAKLETKFRNVVARRTGRDRQRHMYNMHIYAFTCNHNFRGIHDCLVPVSPYLAEIFKHLRTKGKLPPKMRAMDMRHVLLILPFFLEGLLTVEVEEYNRRKSPMARIVDPEPIMEDIIIMLLSLYELYRPKFPAKDEEDIKDFGTRGKRFKCMHILHILQMNAFCTYGNIHCVLVLFTDILHIN